MTPDLINGAFQCLGTFLIYFNIRAVRTDRIVRGVDWRVVAFFTIWGLWNAFYYPYLGQWLSFAAGLGMTVMNAIYVTHLIHYIRQEKAHDRDHDVPGGGRLD